MSKTDTSRPKFGRRQPRPALRKTSTRKGAVHVAVRNALREG